MKHFAVVIISFDPVEGSCTFGNQYICRSLLSLPDRLNLNLFFRAV